MPYKFNPFTGKLDLISQSGNILSHSELSDMPDVSGTNTDHDARYVVSLGKNGGQTIKGGTNASENLYLVSTGNATKGKIFFGSSAYDEANNRLGLATSNPHSTLHTLGSFALPLVIKTSNYTLGSLDSNVLCDASTGTITITLPPVSGISGRIYTIKKVDSSSNQVIIDGDGTETIDGETTQTLSAAGDAITIIADNSGWKII